jgi:hypothetical protein
MTPPGFDRDAYRGQEERSILLLRVALRLLGEARLRGDFGAEEDLPGRALAITDELTGGAPSPDPRRPAMAAELIRPDRISLAAPFKEDSATTWSLMVDGTLYDGATVGSVRAVRIDPETLSDEERAAFERGKAEWEAMIERGKAFSATRFVRAIAAPPQPGAEMIVLAVLIYEDGFWLESTNDKERDRRTFDPSTSAAEFFADRGKEKPEFIVEDDLGTEYFESGGASWGGGMQVSHSHIGFAPAPPAEARLLRITVGSATVELDLDHHLRPSG